MKLHVTLLRTVAVVHKAMVSVSKGTKAAVHGFATYAEAVESHTWAVKLNKADSLRENAVRAQAKAFEMATDLEYATRDNWRKVHDTIDAIRAAI